MAWRSRPRRPAGVWRTAGPSPPRPAPPDPPRSCSAAAWTRQSEGWAANSISGLNSCVTGKDSDIAGARPAAGPGSHCSGYRSGAVLGLWHCWGWFCVCQAGSSVGGDSNSSAACAGRDVSSLIWELQSFPWAPPATYSLHSCL